MIDVTPAFDDIVARLQTELGSAVPVYRTNVPLDVAKQTTNGMFTPYVVVSLGGGIRNQRSRHMADSRMDTLQYWVVVTSVAPRDEEALKLKVKSIDALFGFVPQDSGQLTPSGGTAQSVANENKVPLIYQHRAMFEFSHNMESVVK